MFRTSPQSAAGTTTPILEIPLGNYSSKSRIKPELKQILDIVFARYSTNIEKATLKIVHNRKTIYLLELGKIDHPACFDNDPPCVAPADREAGIFDEWRSIVVPNGWKCALIQSNQVWVCETRINTNDKLEYRFLTVDEAGNEESTDCDDHWELNPSRAFEAAAKLAVGRSENGQLLAGIGYANPQQILRNFVQKNINHPAVVVDELKPLIAAWLANKNVYRLSCQMILARRAKAAKVFNSILDVLIDDEDDKSSNTQTSPALIFSSSSSAAAATKKPRSALSPEIESGLGASPVLHLTIEEIKILDDLITDTEYPGFTPL